MVSINLRFPRLDPAALAAHLAPVMREAVAAGGIFTPINVAPIDTSEDDDA